MKAMIFAAGIGSRMQPITNSIPKALVTFHGKAILELIIRKLINHGFDEIIINVRHFADQIVEFLGEHDQFGIRMEVSFESEKLLGTGGGLKKAAWFFDDGETFLIHNTDILSDVNLKEMYESHLESGASATLAASSRESSRVFLFQNGELSGWRNSKTDELKPVRDYSNAVEKSFSGIHVFEPRLFEKFPDENVFSIVDFYLRAARTEKVCFFEHSPENWFDIGSVQKLRLAESKIKREDLEKFIQ